MSPICQRESVKRHVCGTPLCLRRWLSERSHPSVNWACHSPISIPPPPPLPSSTHTSPSVVHALTSMCHALPIQTLPELSPSRTHFNLSVNTPLPGLQWKQILTEDTVYFFRRRDAYTDTGTLWGTPGHVSLSTVLGKVLYAGTGRIPHFTATSWTSCLASYLPTFVSMRLPCSSLA